MSNYTITTTISQPYDDTVEAVREALGDQGFGVLTEIDLQAALKEKLDVDIAPQVILGACRPPLAYEAIQAEPSIAAVLPCNVVVREEADGRLDVAFMDPVAVLQMTSHPEVARVAHEVRGRLERVRTSLVQGAVDGTPG